MSHFSTIQVEIKDADILHETLLELGHTVDVNGWVRGYLWQKIRADFVIKRKNGFDIGFRRVHDHYELITDVWGTGIEPTSFLNTVVQKYAHKKLLHTLRQQGATVEGEEVMADGTIRVIVGQWQ
ncbi:MAG: DUF1257 domain-containing protein [Synechococcales cyanobacterium]